MAGRRITLLALFALTLFAAPLHAADWPTRPVTVLVPFGAGGNTDMMARLGAQHLSAKFGQSFVVENRPSAGGALATGQVATAAPDGYTLLFSASSILVLTPQLQKLNFDPMKQLVPLTNMGTGTQMIAIKRELPVTTLPSSSPTPRPIPASSTLRSPARRTSAISRRCCCSRAPASIS